MGLLDREYTPGVFLTTMDNIVNWAKRSSLWPLTFGIACCAIEMILATTPRFDLARFGAEVFRATPRQADLMIVAGTVNHKLAKRIMLLYEQMPAHKKVIAMGSCAISGGPYINTYNVVNGVDLIIPVDIYIPGCPPRPEALIDGFIKLQRL
ncbi:MAG: NADH-quinone oxidoreductase subunit B family protein, partial [bacterium]